MSILRYLKKADPIPEGDSALEELLGASVLKDVNAEMRNVTGMFVLHIA